MVLACLSRSISTSHRFCYNLSKVEKLFILERVEIYSIIIENKWIILLVLEVFAWSATFFMIFSRYKLQSAFWFKVGSVVLVLTGFVPQILLGVINFFVAKELDLFSLVIVLLVIFGFTFGKNQVLRLDAWAQKKFSAHSSS